jgi:hypothetical protein
MRKRKKSKKNKGKPKKPRRLRRRRSRSRSDERQRRRKNSNTFCLFVIVLVFFYSSVARAPAAPAPAPADAPSPVPFGVAKSQTPPLTVIITFMPSRLKMPSPTPRTPSLVSSSADSSDPPIFDLSNENERRPSSAASSAIRDVRARFWPMQPLAPREKGRNRRAAAAAGAFAPVSPPGVAAAPASVAPLSPESWLPSVLRSRNLSGLNFAASGPHNSSARWIR